MERVTSTTFLCVHITGPQTLYHWLKKRKKASLLYPQTERRQNTLSTDQKQEPYGLHQVKAAEIIGAPLTSVKDICSTRLTCRAFRITSDSWHLSHSVQCTAFREETAVYEPGPAD